MRERDRHAHAELDGLAALLAGIEAPLLDRLQRSGVEGRIGRLLDPRTLDLALLVDDEKHVDLRGRFLAQRRRQDRRRLIGDTGLLVEVGEREQLVHAAAAERALADVDVDAEAADAAAETVAERDLHLIEAHRFGLGLELRRLLFFLGLGLRLLLGRRRRRRDVAGVDLRDDRVGARLVGDRLDQRQHEEEGERHRSGAGDRQQGARESAEECRLPFLSHDRLTSDGGGDTDLRRPGQLGLIDDLHEHPGRRFLVGLDDDGDVLGLDQALDERLDAGDRDVLAAVDHLALRGERDQDARLLELRGGCRLWLVHLDAALLHEDRRHDEEDEQDEDAVDERGHVDPGLGFVFGGFGESSHFLLLSSDRHGRAGALTLSVGLGLGFDPRQFELRLRQGFVGIERRLEDLHGLVQKRSLLAVLLGLNRADPLAHGRGELRLFAQTSTQLVGDLFESGMSDDPLVAQTLLLLLGADRLQVGQEGLVLLEATLELVLKEEPRQRDDEAGLGRDQSLGDARGDHGHRLVAARTRGQGVEGGEHARHRAEESDERRCADADRHDLEVADEGQSLGLSELSEVGLGLRQGLTAGRKIEAPSDRALAQLGVVDPLAPDLLGHGTIALRPELQVDLHAEAEHHEGDDGDRPHGPAAIGPDLDGVVPDLADRIADIVEPLHGFARSVASSQACSIDWVRVRSSTAGFSAATGPRRSFRISPTWARTASGSALPASIASRRRSSAGRVIGVLPI